MRKSDSGQIDAHGSVLRMTIWGVRVSSRASSETSRVPAWAPADPRCSLTHWAICAALELIEPAGPALSMLRYGTARSSPSGVSTWGWATFSISASGPRRVTLRVIPRGSKMRRATKSSQVAPESASITSPAAIHVVLLYWNVERSGKVMGWWRTCRSASSRVRPLAYQRRSPRRSPELWLIRSRTRRSRVT